MNVTHRILWFTNPHTPHQPFEALTSVLPFAVGVGKLFRAQDMDPLALPPKETLREIAARQEAKRKEIEANRPQAAINEQDSAAKLIQVSIHSDR